MTNTIIKRFGIVCVVVMTWLIHPLQAQNERLVFSPHWIPQAQFAGFYVALDQGFYKDAGLDVQIVHSSANVSSLDLLKNGKADIVSSFLMDGIKLRVNGLPLVNIAQLSQHSALMVITKKTSGISRMEDLQGKKIAIWSSGFDDVLFAYMRDKKIDMQIVRIHSTINLFLMDGVDALMVMNYNEYDQVINSGINEDELNTFYFADYGYDVPEDGLFCLSSIYEQKQASLEKFVKASLRGWEYAGSNKAYTIDLVVDEMKKAHLPNNRAHQCWMLDRLLELMTPGNKKVQYGQLLRSDFLHAFDIIKMNQGNIKSDLTMEEFHKGVSEE